MFDAGGRCWSGRCEVEADADADADSDSDAGFVVWLSIGNRCVSGASVHFTVAHHEYSSHCCGSILHC